MKPLSDAEINALAVIVNVEVAQMTARNANATVLKLPCAEKLKSDALARLRDELERRQEVPQGQRAIPSPSGRQCRALVRRSDGGFCACSYDREDGSEFCSRCRSYYEEPRR